MAFSRKGVKMYRLITGALLFSATWLYGEKVEIVSDAMQAENAKKEVQFVGHVKIKQAQTWLHAHRVIVSFDENNETKQYEARGGVVFQVKTKESTYKGRAQRVTYNPLVLTYKLSGKASIEDISHQRRISGEEILFDAKSGDAKVKGNPKKPVKFIFEMEK
jgi:lipopolysaccharide export system protein LptA